MKEQGMGARIVRLELKYCECCGGLLLRRAGEEVVYCGACARKVSELPVKKRAGVKRDSEGMGNIHVSATAPGRIGPKSVAVEEGEDRRLG